MKTLFMMEDFATELGATESPFFFELDGDYEHLDGIAVNADYEKEDDEEMREFLLDCEIELAEILLNESPVMLEQPTKDWDFFVRVAFFPRGRRKERGGLT